MEKRREGYFVFHHQGFSGDRWNGSDFNPDPCDTFSGTFLPSARLDT